MTSPPRPSAFYSLVAAASWPVVHLLYRYRAYGTEQLPAEGGYVLAAGHVSNFDPWALGLAIWPKRFLRFMAKSELFWFPLSALLSSGGAFRVNRGTSDTEAIEAGVPLIPAGIRGTDGLARLHALRVRYGAPIRLDDLGSDDIREASRLATERLMAAIGELEASL